MQDIVGVDESHSSANVAHDAQSLFPFHVRFVHMQNHIEAGATHLFTD